MKTRIIKIEETGDFFRRKLKPKIRLTGACLDRAGFKAGRSVRIEFIETGVLLLKLVGVPAEYPAFEAGHAEPTFKEQLTPSSTQIL